MTASTQNMQDLSVMMPAEETIEVAGIECTVKRVRMRELMLLAKVITNGAADAFSRLDFSAVDADQTVAAALITAIPNADREFMQILQAMVMPKRKLSDEERAAFNVEIANPDMMVGLDVIRIIATQEKDTFRELLGKAKTVFATFQALYLTGKKDS